MPGLTSKKFAFNTTFGKAYNIANGATGHYLFCNEDNTRIVYDTKSLCSSLYAKNSTRPMVFTVDCTWIKNQYPRCQVSILVIASALLKNR